MTTPYWSDFVPNSTFYRILSGFHRTFATVVACWQGTLTPQDTWSRPFGFYLLRPILLSELLVIFPDYSPRISLGTFSILLQEYVSEGITHPVFYGDLVSKLRRVKSEPNFVSSGSKIIKRLRRRKYNPSDHREDDRSCAWPFYSFTCYLTLRSSTINFLFDPFHSSCPHFRFVQIFPEALHSD